METKPFDPYGKQILDSFHPLCPSADLGKEPKAFQIGSTKLVAFRDHKGMAAILEDRCSHRFTPLSHGKVLPNGRLECPYHGWNFDAHGGCRNPSLEKEESTCSVPAFQAVEKHSYVWVANPGVPMDRFPVIPRNEHEWIFVTAYPIQFQAPFHVVVDNFSEDEHFPYVHSMFGWDRNGAKKVNFTCEKTDENIFVTYHGPQRPFPTAPLYGLKKHHWIKNEWKTHFNPFWITYKTWVTDVTGEKWESPNMNDITIFFNPAGPHQTMMHIFQYVRYQSRFMERLFPLFRGMLVKFVKQDVMNDVDFTQKLGPIPYSYEGAKLGKYDKPLVWTRQMLEKFYFKGPHV